MGYKHALPEFGRDWLKSLHNFFLIRDPKEIVVSWHKVYGKVTKHDIGIEELYNIFKEVEPFSARTPLVIDSTDLIKNPKKALNLLCSKFGLGNLESKTLNYYLQGNCHFLLQLGILQ